MALSMPGSKVERRKDADFYPQGCSDEEKSELTFLRQLCTFSKMNTSFCLQTYID